MAGTHTEVGLKPQLSPRGCATKEEELKSLLTAAQTSDLHHCEWLCKLITCRTSELTMSAPAAKVGQALAAVEFVGLYTRGLGPVSLSCPNSNHSGCRSMIIAILGPDFSGSMLVVWRKQNLRGTKANCQHTHG